MLLSGFVIALLAALPLTAHAAAPDAAMPSVALARRIDADVTLVLHYTETPGATILILKDGRPLYAHAYGFRTLADHQPARIDTHYEIGSITKQLTAAAILQLRDAGKLDLDAKVSTYIPDAPHASEVTMRQLLTHTSGLADFIDASSEERATQPATFDQLMAIVADKPLNFPPGSKVSYSNTGYIILGRIIELISHEKYRDYVRTHLLQPAGMNETFTVTDETSLPTMATGYRHVDGKLERGLTIHESFGWSAGNLVSTVGDVENWNAALTGGKIVPLADYSLMSTPQKATDSSDTGYGLGLFITSVDGQPRISHTGSSTFGFTAANFYFPRQDVRIIALTNNADVPEAAEMLTTAIFNDLFPPLARAALQPARGEDAAVTAKTKAVFEHLQKGLTDGALVAPTLEAKLKAGLDQRMAHQFGPYGMPTAFIFKGYRSDSGKQWSDYLIAFGPGSTLKFSVALGDDGKIVSFGFDTF